MTSFVVRSRQGVFDQPERLVDRADRFQQRHRVIVVPCAVIRSNLYRTIASILGRIWWIALGAIITVYAAEVNVVLTRHLWPRSIRRERDQPVGDPSVGADVGSTDPRPHPAVS